MKDIKWIWADTPVHADEYATFFDEFDYTGGQINIDISVSGDYVLYINGTLSAFSQYPDYETYKVYDTVDITPFARFGKNTVKIICWYIGLDSLTSLNLPRGVYYKVYSGDEVMTFSSENTLCAKNLDYISHQKKKITMQLGYSYLFDTRFAGQTETKTNAKAQKGFNNLVLRQNQKTRFGEYVIATPVTGKTQIYDLGKECCGFLRVKFRAQDGEKVRITFGEHLVDGKVRDKIADRDFSVEIIANGTAVDFTGLFKRLGCRYLQVYGDTAEIYEIGIQEIEYPFVIKPYEIDNELRKKIYDTSVRTLTLCVHEHYEDCPWREQAMYIQDSRNQMLCGYYAFDNAELTRASILSILNGQRENGLFEICFPAKLEFTIPSFSLTFPAMILEYVEFTGDEETMQKSFPAIEKALSFFIDRIDNSGLFKTVTDNTLWHFYEWAGDLDGDFFSEDESKRLRNCYDVLINAFLSWACKKTSLICARMQNSELAREYEKISERLNTKINEVFLDKDKKIYRTYLGKEDYSQLANALCILCGACPIEFEQDIAQKVAYGYENIVETTLSMNLYRYDALLKVDKDNYADFILQEIDKKYGKMLDAGATSFWETEKGEADFDGAGSLCHGWSAIPVYYYHLLGVGKNK